MTPAFVDSPLTELSTNSMEWEPAPPPKADEDAAREDSDDEADSEDDGGEEDEEEGDIFWAPHQFSEDEREVVVNYRSYNEADLETGASPAPLSPWFLKRLGVQQKEKIGEVNRMNNLQKQYLWILEQKGWVTAIPSYSPYLPF
jgi:hypothetical protein